MCVLALQELPLLQRVEIACEDLLARCMENYYSLSENAPSGIAENGMDTSEQPAPALVEAVLLCSKCPFLPPLLAYCHNSLTAVLMEFKPTATKTCHAGPGTESCCLHRDRE